MKTKKYNGRELACGAFRTGTDNVVLAQSTEHTKLSMDFVTKGERWGDLWNENREKLKSLGFHLEASHLTSKREKDRLHETYKQLFFELNILQTTIKPNHTEWHLARRFSFTSRQIHGFIMILKNHFFDVVGEDAQAREDAQAVFTYLWKDYDTVKRMEDKEKKDKDAESEMLSQDESSAPIIYYSHDRSIEDLLENGPDSDSMEQEVQVFIHKVLENLEGEPEKTVQGAEEPFLREFF